MCLLSGCHVRLSAQSQCDPVYCVSGVGACLFNAITLTTWNESPVTMIEFTQVRGLL